MFVKCIVLRQKEAQMPNPASFLNSVKSVLAVAFYDKGVLIKKYLIGDLFADPKKLPRSGSGFQWQKRIAFDDASGRLEIMLVTGQKKLFTVRSGKMVTKADAQKTRRQ